jgi:hypothetical protein
MATAPGFRKLGNTFEQSVCPRPLTQFTVLASIEPGLGLLLVYIFIKKFIVY